MFFLLGATASGKSDLAAEVALRCGAEIVGADAFQVYDGLDRLTAKPAPGLLARVRHHLIGEIPLGRKFDVALYREQALARIRQIQERGKRALIVGGTGLYVRALADGLSELPEGNAALRAELEGLTLGQLQEKYAAMDPRGMERIDRQNRRRLVRAIEVSVLTGAPFSTLRADWSGGAAVPGEASGVILERDRTELCARIDARVRQMFNEGVVNEVAAAAEAGPTAAQAIGYSEIKAHLRGEITLEACIDAVLLRTRRYAKRQLTWLRGENRFSRINLTNQSQSEAVETIVGRLVESAAGVAGEAIDAPGVRTSRDV
jgi:tRNA dimethylallyltransferase